MLVRQGARVRTLPATNATRPNSDDPLSKKGGERKEAGLDTPVFPREENRQHTLGRCDHIHDLIRLMCTIKYYIKVDVNGDSSEVIDK